MSKLFVVFDLDGTLLNTISQIEVALSQTFKRNGLLPPSSEKIMMTIGLPLPVMLQEFSVPNSLNSLIVSEFRTVLSDLIELGTPYYPGVPEVLNYLTENGYLIGVATNKPTDLAIKTLRCSELNRYTFHVQGTDGFAPKPNPLILEKLQEQVETSEVAIMIGDRCEDIETGVNFDIPTIGISQTAHSLRELKDAGANLVFQNFEDLFKSISSVEELISRGH
jgi:HAD superfamily hydrolase (TIGR01549 family)